MASKKDVVLTGLDFEKREFTWVIEHFDMVRKSKDFINSQNFKFQAGETLGLKTDWIVDLAVTKDDDKDSEAEDDEEEGTKKKEEWIGIYLTAKNPPADITEINALVRLRIKEVDEGEVLGNIEVDGGDNSNDFKDSDDEDNDDYFNESTGLINYINDEDAHGGDWGWDKVIPKDAESKDLPLVNGSLIVQIQMTIYGKRAEVKVTDDLTAVEKKFLPRFTEKLQNDLANLLENPSSSSDAETRIVSKDKIKFAVNRGILSARNPVFERMLQTDMKESRTGVITVSELGSKSIKVLLRFIYTGTLHKDWSSSDVIVELVYAANKYQIRDLMEFLDQALGSVCRKENAGKLLNLTKKLGMKKAEQDLFEFLKRQITSPEDFAKFGKDVNAKDII